MVEQQQEITIAVVGSREACDYAFVEAKLLRKLEQYMSGGLTIKQFVSGEAPGVDAMVVDFCAKHKFNYRGIPADWDTHGKAAGFLRNSDIVAAADVVIAFWDRKSKGTKDSIDKALASRKILQIYTLPEFPENGEPYRPTTRRLLKA